MTKASVTNQSKSGAKARSLTLVAIAGLVAAQQLVSLPGDTRLWRAVQNSLHTPLFFLLALLLWWLAGRRPIVTKVIVVALLLAALGATTELAQTQVLGRSASVSDLVRNAIGSILGLSSAVLLSLRPRHGVRTLGLVAVASGLALTTLWSPWAEWRLRQYRRALLPQLVDFDDKRTAYYLSTNRGAHYHVRQAPLGWEPFRGRSVLQVDFGRSDYPTIFVDELQIDSNSYNDLVIEAYSPASQPWPITIAVQLRATRGTAGFVERQLPPGPSTIRLPLSTLVNDAENTTIRTLMFYVDHPEKNRSLQLGSIYVTSRSR